MTIDAIKETVHAEPFHPFGLRLADGKVVKAGHPDYIAFGPKGRTVVVYGADDSFRILDVMRIAAVTRNKAIRLVRSRVSLESSLPPGAEYR